MFHKKGPRLGEEEGENQSLTGKKEPWEENSAGKTACFLQSTVELSLTITAPKLKVHILDSCQHDSHLNSKPPWYGCKKL